VIDSSSIASLIGATVVDRDNDKIGSVGQVYVDPDTNRPLWASVKTGLFGTSESFVPLEGADYTDDQLRVGYEKAFVKDAPRIDPDGALSEDEEGSLYSYYNLGGTDTGTSYDTTDTDTTGADTTVGHDTSGPTTDDAMTRSEEQLHVGTERVQTGRARLRKYVVTEDQTVTVPVSHEEVRIEREPITDANAGDAYDGPAISEEEHEVTLTAERPVVEKEAVPVERVRLDTETVTEQAQVDEQVRKERIELEGDDDTRGRTGL
jgi:uncharacterized protein (TIGR02271 family)